MHTYIAPKHQPSSCAVTERFTYMRRFLGSGRIMVKLNPNWISFGSQYFKNSELATNNLKVRKWHIKNAEFLPSLENEKSLQ